MTETWHATACRANPVVGGAPVFHHPPMPPPDPVTPRVAPACRFALRDEVAHLMMLDARRAAAADRLLGGPEETFQ